MTTFALVAGGSHNAWCWARLIPEIERLGHRAIAVATPTSDQSKGLADFADAVAEQLKIDTGDLVIVGHSLAGRYLPLVAARLPGVRLVFLCAIVPAEGEEPHGRSPQRDYDAEGRQLPFAAERAAEVFYADCDATTIAWACAQLSPTSTKMILEPFPDDGWPSDVATAYILCTDDQAVSPSQGRDWAVDRLGVKPIELPGSHSPFLSRPALLAETLVSLVDDDAHWATHP